MKKVLSFILSAALLLSMGGCQGAPADLPSQSSGGDPAASAAAVPLSEASPLTAIPYDDYAAKAKIRDEYPMSEKTVETLAVFCSRSAAELLNAQGNNCYSPVSLYYALAVAAAGAQGETRQQMLTLLGAADEDALAELCRSLYRNLFFQNEFGTLRLGTSLWTAKNSEFRQEYLRTAAENYYSSVYGIDFSDAAAGKTMSNWVSEQTDGLLQPQIEPDAETLLSILSTVYLKDEWTSAFLPEMTEPAVFHSAGGQEQKVDFMHKTTSGNFVRGENFLRAQIGTKNSASMIFILPDEGTPLAELLTEQGLAAALGEGTETYGEIVWSIPKFSFGSRYDLRDSLKKLGMTDAFYTEKADFSGMSEEKLFLNEAIQEAHISIDENGMEAGAYTELGFCGAGMPQDTADMNLNRPFLFAVEKDGAILFIGTCCEFDA